MSDWVVVYQNGAKSRGLSRREGALSLAADHILRQHLDVLRIEGPDGEVIGRKKIDQWAKDNPPQ